MHLTHLFLHDVRAVDSLKEIDFFLSFFPMVSHVQLTWELAPASKKKIMIILNRLGIIIVNK